MNTNRPGTNPMPPDGDRPKPPANPPVIGCKHCGSCGSAETYAGQACMPIRGRVRGIDWCIHQIVAALNAGGVETVACCCGHGEKPGRIDLADGRVLTVTEGRDQ